jgi:hypothetical protein
MTLLFASVALAQAGKADLPDAPQPQASASAQSGNTQDANAGASGDNTLISQAGRYPRLPRRPVRAPRGYAYGPAAPMPGFSPLGALIGFGVGATLGASASQDTTGRGRVAVGLIIGVIGAGIGGAIGALPHARGRYPSDPDDDDDSDLRSETRKDHSGQSVSARPAAPGRLTGIEAPEAPALDAPTVP